MSEKTGMKVRIGLIAIILGLFVFIIVVEARAADDSFWYIWPSPQAYLYVEDPLRYRIWQAEYGDRVVTDEYILRRPWWAYERARRHRRQCEIRILARWR